jgi:hypothetical protein
MNGTADSRKAVQHTSCGLLYTGIRVQKVSVTTYVLQKTLRKVSASVPLKALSSLRLLPEFLRNPFNLVPGGATDLLPGRPQGTVE